MLRFDERIHRQSSRSVVSWCSNEGGEVSSNGRKRALRIACCPKVGARAHAPNFFPSSWNNSLENLEKDFPLTLSGRKMVLFKNDVAYFVTVQNKNMLKRFQVSIAWYSFVKLTRALYVRENREGLGYGEMGKLKRRRHLCILPNGWTLSYHACMQYVWKMSITVQGKFYIFPTRISYDIWRSS